MQGGDQTTFRRRFNLRRKKWAHIRVALEPETESTSSSPQLCCVLPFPLPGKGGVRLGLCKIESIDISGGGASHIRIVLSSEHDANMRSLRGFQATELTLPSPWPERTSSRAPVSRCHTYTLPSVCDINENFRGDETVIKSTCLHFR